MKRLSFAVFLISISVCSYAGWSKVETNTTPSIGYWETYFDYDSVLLNKDGLEIWTMRSFAKPQIGADPATNKDYFYKSDISLVKLNCRRQTAINVNGTDYAEAMGRGDIKNTFQATKEDISQLERNARISPSSPLMLVWKKYCK